MGGREKDQAAQVESGLPTPPKRKKRRKKGITALSRQSMDKGWQLIDSKIGGREGLLAAALSSSSPKAAILVDLLLDSAHRRSGTKKLAQRAGMSAADVVDLFRDRRWLEATLALHDRLPEVIEGAVTDAAPSYIPCEECKSMPTDPPCWACKGKGETRRPGDKDKLIFVGKAVGMIDKGGPLVQTNIQVNAQQQASNTSFEDLLRRATVKVGAKQIEGVIDAEEIKQG